MVLGDVHGNADWLRFYVYPRAIALGVDCIVQVGDFGYWEHTDDGVRFLDECSSIATVACVPLYWLRGNHDNISLLLKRYGDKRRGDVGFIPIREGVWFIPDGTLWNWQGSSFRAFGGAYSVDKSWRIRQEMLNHAYLERVEADRAKAKGREPEPVPSRAGTLWFPEEEMTDGDMDMLLSAHSDPVDVVFSHDKPRCTNPGWNRKDLPLCLPNQDRLQRALYVHEPSYWFHGHLHYHYVQPTMSGPHQRVTTVVSLEPDDGAAEAGWQRHNTWALIDLVDGQRTVTLGADARQQLDQAHVNDARDMLSKS